MTDLSDVALFMAALTAVYLLPGPDMALLMSTSAARGMKSGLTVALGLALSRTLHVALSALGLATLFHTHPMLFDGVRWLGAAYFLLLAWKMLQSDESGVPRSAIETRAGLVAVQRGVLTNLLNPKALMFCALLLPQFVSTEYALATQYLLLGSILVGFGFLLDSIYALTASSLSRRWSDTRSVKTTSKLVFASVFGFAAVRLVLSDD